MQSFMSQLSFDDEDYYFQIAEELEDDKQFILIIYDIVDNKRRVKFAKFLEEKLSAFEAMLSSQRYEKMVREIPKYIELKDNEDNVRIYRITGKGKVTSWGTVPEFEEEIILI